MAKVHKWSCREASHTWQFSILWKSFMYSSRITQRSHHLRVYPGGLGGHMGRDKTVSLIEVRYFLAHLKHDFETVRYFLPHLKHDVEKFIKHYYTCQTAKGQAQNSRVYTLPLIPNASWEDLSMDFILGLPCIQRGSDFIFFVVDWFSKIVNYIAQLFFLKVVRHHGLPRQLYLIMATNVLVIFRVLYGRDLTQLCSSAAFVIHIQMDKLRSPIA